MEQPAQPVGDRHNRDLEAPTVALWGVVGPLSLKKEDITMRVLALSFIVLALVVTGPVPAQPQTLGEMYRKASPSVVVIRAKGREVSKGGVTRFGETGSGVLVTPDGKVVTASHVVHGMEDITVEFLGRDPVRARVIAFQPAADLALLQLDVVPPDPPVATIADSSRVDIGDPVFIIGAPYGLTYSLSSGIISARWNPNTVNREFPRAEFFQTDATINTGNSGGPMFNTAGEVIGIVSHMITKSGGSEGLGFVVTTHTVRQLLFEKRAFYLGVDGQIVSGPVAMLLNVPQEGGYLVKTVVKDSLGEHLGLRAGDRPATIDGQEIVLGGDIILAAQGINVLTIDDLVQAAKAIRDQPPGREVGMRVLRAGKVVDLATIWSGAEGASSPR
jgi:serine protease Do